MKSIYIVKQFLKLFSMATIMCFVVITSLAQDIRWQTDNTIYSSVMTPTTLYIGGGFNYVGKFTGTAVVVPEATGNAPKPNLFSKINVRSTTPSISSIIPDGLGGYYLAGSISYLGGSSNPGNCSIMHFDANNWFTWGVTANGTVNCLYLSGSVLFAGGSFSSVNDGSAKARKGIVAINTGDGTIRTFNPAFTGTIDILSITGSGPNLYVGGALTFGTFKNLVSVNALTGLANSGWTTANNPNRKVRALAVSGSNLFVGGEFDLIGSTARKGIAAVSAANESLTAFDPAGSSGGIIKCLALSGDGSILYAGGSFGNLQGRKNLIAINTSTAIVTAWNPDPISEIVSMALSGNRLYVAGPFRSFTGSVTIGGQSRNFLAAINTNTGLDDNSWVTLLNGNVSHVSVSGGHVFLGGEFTSVGGERRNRAAAIDYVNDVLLPWNPDANGTVRVLVNNGGDIFAGGDFTQIGGLTRSGIAALDKLTGQANASWSADANATVRALYIKNNSMYAGGDFTVIGAQSRNRIAKLDVTAGSVDASWNPNADGSVRTITGYGNKIYAGGVFNNIGGSARNWIAALDETNTGSALAWYPPGGAAGRPSMSAPAGINVISVSTTGIVYAGGNFATMGGQDRHHLVSMDDNGAVLMAFNANPSSANEVNAIYPSGNFLYVGGSFNDVQTNTQHQHLAELYPLTGSPTTSFFSRLSGSVNTIGVNGTTMYYGGGFGAYTPDYSTNPLARNSYLSFHTANGGMIVLPVGIRNFSVRQQANTRIIGWQADNETAGGYVYEVQRSANRIDFSSIAHGQITHPSADQRHEIQDNDLLLSGTYHYRLKTIQADGKPGYSAIAAVKIAGGNQLKIFPTVITDGKFTVMTASANTIIRLTNGVGQTVATQTLQAGANSISTHHLSKGIYHYTVISRETAGEPIVGTLVIK